MGKIRTRTLGFEEVEKQQKEEQKKRSLEKKSEKKADKETEGNEQTAEKTAKKKAAKKIAKAKVTKQHPHGKQYLEAKKEIKTDKTYSLAEALKLLKKIKFAKFDESVELHLNVIEIGLKGEVELPHATGKITRVKIIDDATLENLAKGIIDFDVLIAHPSFMPKLAKYARILGPKGLMPNPKAGTVSPNPEVVAKKFAKGSLRWKTEAKFPLIHQMVGKISAEEKNLIENVAAFILSVGKEKIKAATIKTTMSPGIKLNLE